MRCLWFSSKDCRITTHTGGYITGNVNQKFGDRKQSDIYNRAGGTFQGIERGAGVASATTAAGRPSRGYSVTSKDYGYETTSPGPLSPGSPPGHTPGSPTPTARSR